MKRSTRRVMAAARGVSRVVQPGGAHLRPPARADEHPHQVCDGDQGNGGEFEGRHGRLLVVVVRYGRGARIVAQRPAKCEIGHTSLKLFAAANRHLRAFWERLVAEEAQHRSIGYFLR